MKERPILFSGAMVRALLDGTKTQTRRIVKPQPAFVQCLTDGRFETSPDGGFDHGVDYITCPYGQPGDKLWVKETFTLCDSTREDGNRAPIYRATSVVSGDKAVRWKPSIFMPRWASRIDRGIIGVRVERLNDISPDDAASEGLHYIEDGPGAGFWTVPGTAVCGDGTVEAYEQLWESINGPGSWALNPYVWVIEFSKA